MSAFNYTARDLSGIDHKGSIETSDPGQVARILSKRGLVLISVSELKKNKNSIINRFFNKVSFDDLVVATRQLSTMIESGLVLSEALDILVGQQQNNRFKEVLEEVSRDIKGGLDLAAAFRRHPDVFPSLYTSLVKAGEQSGKLDTVLIQMANSLERDREFKNKIKGALIYPAIILIMMGGVITIMMVFVIPRLTSLYAQSNIDLPLPTKILIVISNGFVNFWWLILAAVVGSVFAFKRWISTPFGRFTFDIFLLKMPIIKKVIEETSLTNFTRTFGLLTAAGISILDSINIVAEVIGNGVYRRALKDAYQGVERGLTLSAQLDATGVFPKLVSQMIRVGEETGKVDAVSFKMAEYYESEADHILKNLTVIIEPVILVVLGVMVAFLVLSIILPIYKLTTSIS